MRTSSDSRLALSVQCPFDLGPEPNNSRKKMETELRSENETFKNVFTAPCMGCGHGVEVRCVMVVSSQTYSDRQLCEQGKNDTFPC